MAVHQSHQPKVQRGTTVDILWPIVRVAILVYAGFVVLLFLVQRRMIYFPQKASVNKLTRVAPQFGLEPWTDSQGNIVGWKTPEPEGVPFRRVLVFHGNAGFALHRTYFSDLIPTLPGQWQVFLFEYPGYGARDGSPSEHIIKDAARQAAAQLLNDRSEPIFLLGESLGSAFVCHLAAEFPDEIEGLLLITPFNRLADVAAFHYRFLPVRWLLRDPLDAQRPLSQYAGRVSVVIAELDEVVPARFGRALFESYPGPKRLWVLPGANHNTIPYFVGADWLSQAFAFLMTGEHTEPSP